MDYKDIQRVDENGVKSPLINRKVPYVKVNKEEEIVGAKAVVADALENLSIDYSGVSYDSDSVSITRMASVVALASAKFNELLYNDVPAKEAYEAIYINTKVTWKGADNLPHEVQVKSIVVALEKSMLAVAGHIVK